MKAGIIGGTGKMGQLFAPVFERAGYKVLVSGRSTALTNEKLADTCDIVIVSVPIRDTVRIIGGIAPLMRENQLLCDFTSLKVGPVAAMLRSKAEVIGLHPMFGPTVSSISGQTIVVCPARTTDAALSNLTAVFTREGAVCTVTTPEEHDRMMAVVQGLTHFVTICMADSIRRMGIDIQKTEEFIEPGLPDRTRACRQVALAGPRTLRRHSPAEPLRARSDCRVPVGRGRTLGDRYARRPGGFQGILFPGHPAPWRLLRTGAGPHRCPDRVHGEEMTVITLGPEGTFSHELAIKLGCDPVVLEPTIHSIFAGVAAGTGDGIVPIENSEAGGVGETLDGLMVYPLSITAEMYMPIHHHLASLVPLNKIRVIYVHPQTHEQCSGYIEHWKVPVIHTSSNASSAIEAKKTPNAGAIISSSAAVIYRMPIVAEHVENNPENTTRFVRISKNSGPDSPARQVQHPHRPGHRPGRAPLRSPWGLCPAGDQPHPDRVATVKAGHGKICILP